MSKKKSKSKSDGNTIDFRVQFEGIKKDLNELVRSYLAPLLESNRMLVEHLGNLKRKIEENEESISKCQNQIKQLRIYNANSALSSATCKSVLDLASEVKRQASNQSKLFIRNSENKDTIIDTLNKLMGKDVAIENITSLSENGKAPVQDKSFIVELKSREDILEILKRKASFFKKNGSALSINLARTKLQREFNRHRKLKSGAIEEVKHCPIGSTSDWRPDVPGSPSMGHEVTGVNHNYRESSSSPVFHGFTDKEAAAAKSYTRRVSSSIKRRRIIRKYL